LLILGAAVGGCDQRGIEEHTVPKGVEPTVAAPVAPVETPGADPGESASGIGEPWHLPDGWRRLDGSRPMRVATFAVEIGDRTVEIALSRFAGQTGGVLANVNRWRGQLGLDPIGEGDLEGAINRFESPGFGGYWLRIEGESDYMLAAGVHDQSADQTWFVRASGSAEVMDGVESDFIAFATSFGREPGE